MTGINKPLSSEAEQILGEVDQKNRTEAEDWLTPFARRSNEALAKRAAKKQLEKPPNEQALVEALARKDRTEYDKMRGELADTLGIRVGTLDDKVEAIRKKLAATGAVALPHWPREPWPEEVDGDALLDDLRREFSRYVALPPHADVALALWVLHTYVFLHFDLTPYLAITSPTRRCGKTVLMTLLYWLSCRGKKSDSMSRAAIYRSVDGEKPTLVLDEVGWVFDYKDERQGILCGGFERNGYVEVCEGDSSNITVRRFSTYGPKAFGLIGKLTGTLMDRSISIAMRRKLRTDRVERLRRKDKPEFAELRQRALRWASDNGAALEAMPPAVDDELNDRALDFWEPLYAIADAVSGDWPKLAREAAHKLSGGEDDESALSIALLQDIKTHFEASTLDHVSTKNLLSHLTADAEKPWAEYSHGRPITDKHVAQLLREFKIRSRNVGPEGKQSKGYQKKDFEDAWGRYLIHTPPEGGPDLPSSRPAPCEDYEKDPNLPSRTAVQDDCGPVQDGSLDGTTALDGRTGREKPPVSAAKTTSYTAGREKSPRASGVCMALMIVARLTGVLGAGKGTPTSLRGT
jgi:putative DNA primase/helicase